MEEIKTQLTLDLSQYNIQELIENAIRAEVYSKSQEFSRGLIERVKDEFIIESKLKWSIELSQLDKKISEIIGKKVEEIINQRLKEREHDFIRALERAMSRITLSQFSSFLDEFKNRIVLLEKDEKVVKDE